jgi:endonuclease YncB( thermonuclease family)
MVRRVLAAPPGALLVFMALVGCLADDAPATGSPPGSAQASGSRTRRVEPQPRPHGSRVPVDPSLIRIDDGDTVNIHWRKGDTEIVRILGIDTPETRHLEHDIPYAQPFGEEARVFAKEAFADAKRVELLRSATLDPYRRTLGYVFVDGRNYSVLIVRARLALESISHYGDNGLPKEAAEVLAAAEAAGPVPFEPPHRYRARMRELSEYMKEQGTYPEE